VKALYALYNIYLTFKRQENMWKPQQVYWCTGTWVSVAETQVTILLLTPIYNSRTEHPK